jgi:hypothetical protein
MKITLLLLLLHTVVWAKTLQVRDADVIIKLNAKEMKLLTGSSKKLHEGDSIRFISGKGRVVIDMIQLIQKDDFYQVPLSQSFSIKGYIQAKKSSLLALFDKSKPKERDGIAIKGELPKIERVIKITNQKGITILNDHFTPPPIRLVIRNENDGVVETLVSTNGKITFFTIDTTILKDGYSLLITNGNGDHLALYEIFKD